MPSANQFPVGNPVSVLTGGQLSPTHLMALRDCVTTALCLWDLLYSLFPLTVQSGVSCHWPDNRPYAPLQLPCSHTKTHTDTRTSLLTPASWRMQAQAGMQSQTFLSTDGLHLMLLHFWGVKQNCRVTHNINTHLLRWFVIVFFQGRAFCHSQRNTEGLACFS